MATAVTTLDLMKAVANRITSQTMHMRKKSRPKAAIRFPIPQRENASVSPSGVVTFRILFSSLSTLLLDLETPSPDMNEVIEPK